MPAKREQGAKQQIYPARHLRGALFLEKPRKKQRAFRIRDDRREEAGMSVSLLEFASTLAVLPIRMAAPTIRDARGRKTEISAFSNFCQRRRQRFCEKHLHCGDFHPSHFHSKGTEGILAPQCRNCAQTWQAAGGRPKPGRVRLIIKGIGL